MLAALEAQRALSRYPWPDETAVKVRIGIHTGQASPLNGRYTGLAVHRTARICAAGHGGQVLVSQATQTLLEDEEEDLEVQLRDLGDQRLKDLDRPVHLYQVAAPGLSERFPPLRKEAAPSAAEPVPMYRRRVVLALVGVVLAGVIGAVLFLLTRSGPGGLGSVHVNNVGVIDAKSGSIVAEVPTGIRPGPVAAGSSAVWIGNLDDRTLTRIDPKTRAQVGTISLENRTPTGIAVAPGAVWVAHALLGSVSRVDPQYNTVSATVAAAERSGSGAVTVGGRSVWAVFGNSTLVRINPSTARISGRGFAGSGPAGIVYAEGSVWVANGGDATVYRFSPATFESGPVVTPTVGREPSAIAYGEGSIWVTNAGDDSVTRIDPSSNSTFTIPVGRGPLAIAVSSGAVWVGNSGDGTLSRIDPKTNTVAKTIHTGNVPAGIAVSDGFLWVTVQGP